MLPCGYPVSEGENRGECRRGGGERGQGRGSQRAPERALCRGAAPPAPVFQALSRSPAAAFSVPRPRLLPLFIVPGRSLAGRGLEFRDLVLRCSH